MEFGSRIREARKQLGLSQEQLAHRARLTVKTISAFERGDVTNPHMYSLINIADVLGVEPSWLYEDVEPTSFEPNPKADALPHESEETKQGAKTWPVGKNLDIRWKVFAKAAKESRETVDSCRELGFSDEEIDKAIAEVLAENFATV